MFLYDQVIGKLSDPVLVEGYVDDQLTGIGNLVHEIHRNWEAVVDDRVGRHGAVRIEANHNVVPKPADRKLYVL